MFPFEVWVAYTAACLSFPDNLLAVGRGLSQSKRAAIVSGIFIEDLTSGVWISMFREQ